MKLILQSYGSGELQLVEAPVPVARPGRVVVRTHRSIVSPGTERMVLDLARASLLGKARQRPDQVRKVLDKVRREGVLATLDTVRARLADPMALGYACAGTVVEVGAPDAPVRPGQRVACTGLGFARHAGFNEVPYNLCAPVPDGVDDESAAMAGVAAMALHAVRQARVGLGDHVAVIGLGLLGQIAVQLVCAAGAHPIAIDVRADRIERARQAGASLAVLRDADGLADRVRQATGGIGVDSVLVFAATSDNDPLVLAGELCRDRGVVVAFGAVELSVPRAVYFAKELDLRLSRSTGPGRYDTRYEEDGVDYPVGYVRWTQQRNLVAWLELCQAGRVTPGSLITHRVDIERATEAYALLDDPGADVLGIALTYPEDAPIERTVALEAQAEPRGARGVPNISLVGAGSYASSVLGPLLDKAARRGEVALQTVVSAGGMRARHLGERLGFARVSSSVDAALADDVDLVIFATPHAQHPAQAAEALERGRHVLVEKPLAVDLEGLERVLEARRRADALLVVGFNRRWAPMITELEAHFAHVQAPRVISMRINAGQIPPEHPLHDPRRGGGRLVGEVCHFVDLCCALCEAVVEEARVMVVRGASAPARNDDQLVVQLRLADGSVASITYAAGGDTSASKELIEVMGGGRMARLLDYRRLDLHADGRRRTVRALRPDKGQAAMLEAVVRAVRTRGAAAQEALMPLAHIESVTRTTLALREAS